MSRIVWDAVGEHTYETGVDHGVLYQLGTGTNDKGKYVNGVAWNGLTSVSESPSGAEAQKQYADNMNYLTLYSAEEFGATIEAFTYPVEFEQNDGSASPVTGLTVGQQPRKSFGLAYRTKVGNDTEGDDFGYKLHLVYGCRASPSERGYSTINDSPEAITFSWEITTTPVQISGFEPSAQLIIDSTKLDQEGKAKLVLLESILFGRDQITGTGTGAGDAGTAVTPTLPLPDDVIHILKGDTGYTTMDDIITKVVPASA